MKQLFRRKARGSDARQYKRVRLTYLVKYQMGGKGDPHIANIWDLSAGGVRFWTADRIPDSSILNLSVHLPPLGRSVDAVAQVLRVRRARRKLFYYVAVRFLDLSREDRDAINQFAEELSEDKEASFLIDHARVVVRSR